MFKRVEKRRRKLEEEEALGLDDDLKEMLGIPATDSEESDSDESSDDGEESDDRKGADGQSVYEADEEDEGDEDGVEQHPMSVREALNDPLYPAPGRTEAKLCLVCPGKLLKNLSIVAVHKASAAHTRRFRRFTEMAHGQPEDNAWDYVPRLSHPAASGGTSKRAEKRNAKFAAIKAKRELQKVLKAKAKARKNREAAEASRGATKIEEPAKKKRKESPKPEPTEKPAKTGKIVPRKLFVTRKTSQSKQEEGVTSRFQEPLLSIPKKRKKHAAR